MNAERTPASGASASRIDTELQLPVGAVVYDEANALIEPYSYSDVRLNVELTPLDFSRENKAHRF
jgi:hypothetical protein